MSASAKAPSSASASAKAKDHTFWNTKPLYVHAVSSLALVQEEHGFEREVLSGALEWDTFALDDADKLDEMHRFLLDNYKTPGFPYQIAYRRSHLTLELGTPAGHWIVAMRSTTKPHRPIVACIAGDVRQCRHTFPDIAEDALANVLFIEFLCVHPALRHLGLAPKLIHEISRLAHLSPARIQKAYYNSATPLPGSFCTTPNYHRPLQWERCKLADYIPKNQPILAPIASVRYQFRLGTGSAEDCIDLLNNYDRHHRKVYEPVTPERWVKLVTADCVQVISVFRTGTTERIGCIVTLEHPYKVMSPDVSKSIPELRTVLLYRYGFSPEVSTDEQLTLWNAFFAFAQTQVPHWDAFTTTQPDVARAVGFRQGHAYHHYLYNVRMRPLSPQDFTMIGV